MKKFLLSSIIMLGVCGIASAQTDSKFNKKAQATSTTSTAAPTPQKAAIMPATDATDAAVAAPVAANDIDKAPVAAKTTTTAPAAKTTTQATTVNAAGEVVPSNDAKRREAKMAAVKASTAPKGKQN